MNTLRNLKYRNTNNVPISGATSSTPITKHNTNAKGVFNKLTKRYANLRFLRTSPGRPGNAQPVATGSYDMRGGSEDLKREIGAPILISKTCIDMDTTDCQPSEAWRNVGPSGDRALSTVHINKRITVHDDGRPRDHAQTDKTALRQTRSKSANNLHRSEIKVFLHRAPSLNTDFSEDQANLTSQSHRNDSVQRSSEYSGTPEPISSLQQTRSKGTFSRRLSSTSDANSIAYSSKDSLNISNIRNESSTEGSFSHDSLTGHESSPDEMVVEFRTHNFQTLDARNLFQSIEELNEITRKLNESDEFDQHIDLEYCEHRDNLRPDQRRITLLKVNHSGVLGLEQKREKLGHAWKGLKHWIEEKEVKVKDAVQKHAAMQRVGGVNHEDGSIVPELMDNQNRDHRLESPSDDQDCGPKSPDTKTFKGSEVFKIEDRREVTFDSKEVNFFFFNIFNDHELYFYVR